MRSRRGLCAFFLCCLLCTILSPGHAESVLDLVGQTFENLDTLMTLIQEADEPETVDLTDVKLSLEERKALLSAFPNTTFQWTISVYGVKVSTQDTYLDLYIKNVTSLDELMDYIDCLPNIREVDLYSTKVPEAYLTVFEERHPKIQFNWLLVLANHYHIRTNVTAFSTLKNGSPPLLKSEQFAPLKYLKDLQALDLGHNAITDLSFLYDLPKLKVLILAVNKITDITPIASLKDLEYLELFMNDITDLTPLQGLDKLIDLNLCINDIEDITPLEGLTGLQRLWISRNKDITDESKERLQASLPNTEINFTARMSTGEGWRGSHPRYKLIRKIFYRRVYFPFE